jgi:colicin import membrane protein
LFISTITQATTVESLQDKLKTIKKELVQVEELSSIYTGELINNIIQSRIGILKKIIDLTELKIKKQNLIDIQKQKTLKIQREEKHLRVLEDERYQRQRKINQLKAKTQKERKSKELLETKRKETEKKKLTKENTLNELKVNYINQIASKVHNQWRYQGAKDNWGCDVHILQDVDGNVQSVNVQSCNVDNNAKTKSFKNAIERAVYKASPLPPALNKKAFNREILFYFRMN